MSHDENDKRELVRLRAENEALKLLVAGLKPLPADPHLAESEARYRSVVASMSEGIVVQDSAGVILASNHAAEEILGLSRDQLMGRTSLDASWRAVKEDGSPFLGDDHPAMLTLRTGQGCRNVIMGVHKPDGQQSWIAINSEPVPSNEAQGAAVVCTFTDVSAYRKTMAELRESEERVRLALEAGRMGTWQYEPASGVVTWSPRIEQIFGLAEGTFRGTLDAYGECIHPDDRANMSTTLQRVLAPNAAVDFFHVVHRSAGADERWIECYGRVWRDAQLRVTRMAGTVVDVTDQRRLEAHLVRGQRLEAVGRLAGGIAHDFNNVLTAIVGSADLCLLAPNQLQEHVGLIHESAARAARLVQQLLMFSKRQEAERKVLDVSRVVLGLEGLLRRLAGERVDLTFDVSPHVQRVHADQGQIEQVLMNLVANARDAVPRGGHVQIKVESALGDALGDTLGDTLASEASRDFVVIIVEDDGVGMSQAVIDRAFDPFFTTKETGTGLGLATCYGIVEQLGGSISITSSEGKGTRIRVQLPRSQAELFVEGAVAKVLPKKGSETILLVDDDAMVRSVARDLLESSGYLVLCAEGAEQALHRAGSYERAIDLLLTDVAMPQMSGVALATAMARLRPHTAVLLMSGYSGDAFDRDEAEAARALPFLTKPFTGKELLARVREILDARAQVEGP